MGQLTNQFVSQSYQGLLNLQNTNTGFTTNLQTITDGLGGTSPLQISKTQVNISGAFTVNGAPISGGGDTGSLVTTASFNAYTSSNDSRVNSLISQTGSYVTEAESGSFMITGSVAGDTLTFTKGDGSQFSLQVNTGSLPSGVISGSQQIVDLGFLQTSSFNSYTSSNDAKVNSLIASTGSYATTSSLTSLSQSIATTDLGQNNRLTSLESATSSLQNQINQKLDTGSFNSYTSSNDGKVNDLISKTGSYATTGSNVFNGTQTISGSLNVTGEIVALSASITYLETIYQTSSVIFSSGSNILGDEAGDTQTLWGTVNLPSGPLVVTGSVYSSDIIGTGSLFLKPNQADPRFVEIYNTSPTDTHITASGGQIFLGDDQTYVKVDNYGSVERIDVVAGNELVVSSSIVNLTGSLHQSGTFYPDVIDWISSSIVQSTGSYILTTNASGVTQYDSYQNVASELQQYINTGSLPSGTVSGSAQIVELGFATTGSVDALTGSINSLIAATSSYVTETESGSFMVTGSVAGDTLTFTKGDGSQFSLQVSVATGSLPAGVVSGSQQIVDLGFATTSSVNTKLDTGSFNTYSGNTLNLINQKLDTGSFNSYTSSNDSKVNSLIAATSSYITSAQTSSMSVATASFALNGGVTQLLAGPNITVSPLSGKGQVTISAAGTGTGSFNTATGSYGSFYDTTIQTNPVANTPRSMSFNETAITNGVSISGSISPFNTYIKTEDAGIYNIQFSAQVEKTDSGTDEIDIWIRKNGNDLLDTATKLTLTNNNTKVVAAWNWFVPSAANDYYQLIWSSADTGMRLFAEPSSSAHPGIPSVIATANRIDQFLSNTGSFNGDFNGSFTGSLEGTASFATNALSASFAPMPDVSYFATTGSNIFRGNQTITGSVNVSGSGIANTSGVNTQYFGSPFGGNVGVFNNSNLTEIGLALDGNDWTTNWSKGPILYVNNTAGDTYEGVFGFQNKANYTDGRITLLKNTDLSGSLIVTGGVTGSFRGDGSGLTGITATLPSGVVSGSQQIVDFGFATTGSNVFRGNQTITGSVNVTGSGISNDGGANAQYLYSSFGGGLGVYNTSNSTEIGLALDGASFTGNWTNGPALYVNNNPGDSYDGVFGFQNKANFTDGRITALKPMVFNSGATVTGSFNVTGSSTLSGNGGFPLTVDGTINSKRLHFDKNPFNNDPSSNLGAIRLDGFNKSFYITNYDLADFANKQSVVGLFVNTGSNTINTYLESLFNGTTAKVELMNVSGSRTLRVDVDSSAITGSLTVSGGVTGSFSGDGSGLTGVTATLPNNVATTGSNTFVGNQTITGSVLVSGSATYDIDVVGSIRTSGPSTTILVSGSTGKSSIGQNTINIESSTNSPYLSTNFGGTVSVYDLSDSTEIGLSLDGSAFTGNWSNGPALYVNNTSGDTYDAVFGFQDKTNFTDGRVTVLKPINFNSGATGSFSGDGSGLTGITASAPNNVATTGSNNFKGNQTITGSVNVTGSGISNNSGVNTQYLYSSFGGGLGVYNNSNLTEIGLSLDGASFTGNWTNGPALYVNNNPADSYDAAFGFQNKANFTDGRITALKPMVFNSGATITGSLNVSGSVNHSIVGNNITVNGNTRMEGNNGFPLTVDGTISTKRFAFAGNPFNSNIGGTFGSLNYDGSNTLLQYVNGDFGTPQTSSYTYLTTNTGSNVTSVINGAAYGGTTAETSIINNNGVRTFNVNVDSTTVTGSLTVSGSVSTEMVTVDIRTTTSGSIDLSRSNTFIVLNDNNPAGGHLTFTNHREGQQVTVLLDSAQGGESITLTGALRILGQGTLINLNNSGYSIFNGVCSGGVFYGNFQSS
jgi:hypothetical protein